MGALSAMAEDVPYAIFTANDSTLTFSYGPRPAGAYLAESYYSSPGWFDNYESQAVAHVVFNSSFDQARPAGTAFWFYCMFNLKSITGLEYLHTDAVVDMEYMFAGIPLTSLDLSHFNTSNVRDMSCMFEGCSNLETIYAGSGWTVANVTQNNSTDMFYGCTSLVGGQGTVYDPYYVDKDYAHIDGGPSNPGYFTDANPVVVVLGDVNGDGDVNVMDITALIDIIMNDGDNPRADVNEDEAIDVRDITALIDIIMNM